MKRLLLLILTGIALNSQAQTFEGPTIFNEYCNFIDNFTKEQYFYLASNNENKQDCTIKIYNDELTNIKNIKTKDALMWNSFDWEYQENTVTHFIIPFCIINTYASSRAGELAITQNLFNNDEKWEYIRGSYLCITEDEKKCQLIKAEIIDEDGNVLAEIPTDAFYCNGAYLHSPESYGLYITKMGENIYLVNPKEKYENEIGYIYNYTFYKIIKGTGSGVSFTKVNEFKEYPNPVRQNEIFTIAVDEKNVNNNSYIEICDQNGRIVHRQAVTTNEVKISTHHMQGMYIYNIIENGKSVNTGKVIVK